MREGEQGLRGLCQEIPEGCALMSEAFAWRMRLIWQMKDLLLGAFHNTIARRYAGTLDLILGPVWGAPKRFSHREKIRGRSRLRVYAEARKRIKESRADKATTEETPSQS